ncbi:MAG: sulfotransferase [Pseudomonadota bacterium]
MADLPRVAKLAAKFGDPRAYGRHARAIAKPGLALVRKLEPLDQRGLLFILGCQRSGTSLMVQIFARDWNTRVFGERFNRLTSDDREWGIRLNDLPKVRSTLEVIRSPFLVAKPLVESQQARRLLRYFPNARVVWLYRDYRDVAASNLQRWGMENGVATLRPLISGETGNWRSEHVDPRSRSLITEHFREDMSPYDAAALFWFMRNRQFMRNRLYLNDMANRVMLLPYERLAREPLEVMSSLYAMMDMPFPGAHVIRDVHVKSLGKGNKIPLSPAVEQHCQQLLERLDTMANHKR